MPSQARSCSTDEIARPSRRGVGARKCSRFPGGHRVCVRSRMAPRLFADSASAIPSILAGLEDAGRSGRHVDGLPAVVFGRPFPARRSSSANYRGRRRFCARHHPPLPRSCTAWNVTVHGQIVELDAGAGALLEYLPDPVILFPRARLHNVVQVRLDPQAFVILGDALILHDPKGGGGAFELLESETFVSDRAGKVLVCDRFSMRRWRSGARAARYKRCLRCAGDAVRTHHGAFRDCAGRRDAQGVGADPGRLRRGVCASQRRRRLGSRARPGRDWRARCIARRLGGCAR